MSKSEKPRDKMKVRELPPNEARDLLKRSALDVQIASVQGSEVAFFGAHNRTRSLAVLATEGAVTVWEISGGTEAERRACVQLGRNRFEALPL